MLNTIDPPISQTFASAFSMGSPDSVLTRTFNIFQEVPSDQYPNESEIKFPGREWPQNGREWSRMVENVPICQKISQ